MSRSNVLKNLTTTFSWASLTNRAQSGSVSGYLTPTKNTTHHSDVILKPHRLLASSEDVITIEFLGCRLFTLFGQCDLRKVPSYTHEKRGLAWWNPPESSCLVLAVIGGPECVLRWRCVRLHRVWSPCVVAAVIVCLYVTGVI